MCCRIQRRKVLKMASASCATKSSVLKTLSKATHALRSTVRWRQSLEVLALRTLAW